MCERELWAYKVSLTPGMGVRGVGPIAVLTFRKQTLKRREVKYFPLSHGTFVGSPAFVWHEGLCTPYQSTL